MKKSLSSNKTGLLRKSIPFNLWYFLPFFLTANVLLSYFSLSLPAQLWLGFFGLFLPFLVGLTIALEQRFPRPISTWGDEGFSKIPPWLWFLFVFLVLLARFYRLTSLPFWPLADEGIDAVLGMGQSRLWHWNLLWSESRIEPILIWTLGLYFKLIKPSLFSLRLYPALLSIATSWASYHAARVFLSKWASFLFCWLVTFSFWELTVSRFCFTGDWIPLFQFAGLILLGLFLKAKDRPSQLKYMWLLSFTSGIGFYAWTNWVSVWSCFAFILLFDYFKKDRKEIIFPVIFFLVSALFVIPLGLARLAPGGMVHIQQFEGFHPFRSLLTYLVGVFWNGSFSFPFGTNWGGFFNPLLDSLLFIGVLYLAKQASKGFLGVMMVCLFFSLLPGALTNTVELYRILPLFPFLTFVCAAGLLGLFPAGFKPKPIGLMVILLMGLFLLDSYNFIGRYCDISRIPPERQWRAAAYQHAYEILKNWSRRTGPLYVFSEFSTDYDDKTLNVAVYPFDALQNPNVIPYQPQWSALLVNIRYVTYLQKMFPNLKYEVFETNYKSNGNNTALGLFLIPNTEMPPSMLRHWIEADRVYRSVNLNIKNKNPVDRWGDFPAQFSDLETHFADDPFLTAIYWEKVAFFKIIEKDLAGAERAYHLALKRGYPASHLYYQWGLTLQGLGKEKEAQAAFDQFKRLNNL